MEYLSKQRYDEVVSELNHLIHVEFTNLATNSRMKFEIVSPHESFPSFLQQYIITKQK